MRDGRFFRIPERPADLDAIWENAERLDADRLPDWLTIDDVADYRRLRPIRAPSLADRSIYDLEIDALRDVGCVVEDLPGNDAPHIVHLARPPRDEIWSIGLYAGASPFDLRPCPDVVNPILTRDHVTDVPASFVADPFVLRTGGTWHLLFEVMNWRSGKGEIGWASSGDGRAWHYRGIVLREPFHLSYPLVFEWRGEHYMTPESHQAGAVRLYRAAPFPERWEYVGDLVRGPYLAAPTPFRHANHWWMFVDASPDGGHDTLRLFEAADLPGPWIEHPRSPIIQGDATIARPAGTVLNWKGRLIRLAQECVPYYGTAVRARGIIDLTTSNYRESEFAGSAVLGPGSDCWNAGGMHHLDAHELFEGGFLAFVDGWFKPA